ncbi:MAG: transcription termination factor NusA, partial [SAR324 cluster bacterium]|nr:transcription termination factor NusA [SAR324 cluster bacterium]
MASENIVDAIGDIARDKGISRERLVEVIQEAITAAAKRKFRQYEDIETRLNVTSGEIEVFRYKRVAETVENAENEISLEEARRLDSLAEPGDEVEYEIENQELSRVIAQTARQLIFQKIREAERETIYENFKDRKNEILNGMVVRTERNRAVLSFNNTEAILYGRDQIPNERLSAGEHVRVILLDVLNDPKEASQLVISRTHPVLLTKLFEMEVPEIYDGIVEIVTAVREPGRRAKVAVISNDPDVDPVGACVGMRGSRVQAIISELRGEKIDIIKWNDDLPSYVANSLAPAELTRIKIDDEAGEIDVEVEPDQLALAIGRQGQNVRLASKLTGYKINVASTQENALSLEEQIREKLRASQVALGAIPSAAGESAAGEAPVVGESGSAEPAAGAPVEETEAVASETAAGAPAEETEAVTAEPAEEPASEVEAVAPEPPVEETEAVAAEPAEEPASEVEAVAPETPVEETEAVAAAPAEE